MRTIQIGLQAVLAACIGAESGSAWEFNDIEGAGVGTLNACAATDAYRDGFITIRLYGEEMDIVFQHEDFALPFNETLGVVGVMVDTAPYAGLAISLSRRPSDVRETTSAMQILLRSEDYSELFDVFRNGKTLYISFPSGDGYTIPLAGSAKALNMAADCWKSKETGPDERNPFAVPDKSNPFTGSDPEPKNPFEKDA